MRGPRHQREYEDRGIDCQADLEDDFTALVDKAMASSWSHVEALNGLFELARNHLIMCHAIDEEQRSILVKLKELEGKGGGRKAHH